MEWTQLRVNGTLGDRDTICAVMCMLDSGLMIEDYSDIDMDTVYADLIDEEILKKDKNRISVSFFVPPRRSAVEYAAFLKDRFRSLGIKAEIELCGIEEQAWATAWKKYYKPLPIGKRFIVVPQWEKYEEKEQKLVITMDPGMAFGTGTHETTRLCCELLEEFVNAKSRVLDVGTGSGILAIAAAKLGASSVFCCDIDPVAVRVANENIVLNGVQGIVRAEVSDLLGAVPAAAGGYTLVTANIVADVILRMTPQLPALLAPDAVYITSGIIDTRGEEVKAGVLASGFSLLAEKSLGGWCAFAFRYQG